MTAVEINPNLHFADGCTFVDLAEDVYGGPLAIGQTVEVFESESHLYGSGVVIDIDEEDARVRVDWRGLRIEPLPVIPAHRRKK